MGCTTDLLPYCPAANVTNYPGTSTRMLCTNPNRDAQTATATRSAATARTRNSWSKADSVPGNQVIRQCANCTGFTITYYAPGTA